MKFKDRDEFVKWLSSSISPSIDWSPSVYMSAVRPILNKLNLNIVIPDPYDNGGWKGMTQYFKLIYDMNQSKLSDSKWTSSKYTQPWSTGSSVNNSYSHQSKSTNSFGSSCSTHSNIKSWNEIKEDKEKVSYGYDKIIETLNSIITGFNSLNIANPKLVQQRRVLVDKLTLHLNDIKSEKDEAMLSNKWDKLNIGFFGETNAGKSTIIESLRILLNESSREAKRKRLGSCDGDIVGDGRQDFTQTYHEYEMSVNGQKFVLIDVPGIEGKENLFRGKIGEALRKAHLIFYVNGHNKNIDRGTAVKVKEYMGEGVQIVVLQNVRGNVDQYEYPENRRTLLTSSTNTVLRALEKDFRSLVGNKFSQAIPVMGFLAMCAYGDFSPSRNDLRKKQSMLLEMFGDDFSSQGQARNKIRQISNIDEVLAAITSRANNYKKEIAKANFLKMEMFSKRALNEYIAEVEAKKREFDSYRKQVERFIRENRDDADTTARLFKLDLERTARGLINEFSESMYSLINRSDFSAISNRFVKLKDNISAKIKSKTEYYSNSLAARVKERSSRLTAIPGMISQLSIQMDVRNLGIDIAAIREADDISFGDVARTGGGIVGGAATGAAIGSIVPGIGTLIGGIIGGLVGGGSSIASSSSAQTERARTEARKSLRDFQNRLNKEFEDISMSFSRNAEDEIKKINSTASTRIREVDNFFNASTQAESKLKSTLTLIQSYGR